MSAGAEERWLATYTDAPPDYDGFGTLTVAMLPWTTRRGIMRLVLTPERHAEWQRNRYGSGLYLAYTSGERVRADKALQEHWDHDIEDIHRWRDAIKAAKAKELES